jgi:sortase A
MFSYPETTDQNNSRSQIGTALVWGGALLLILGGLLVWPRLSPLLTPQAPQPVEQPAEQPLQMPPRVSGPSPVLPVFSAVEGLEGVSTPVTSTLTITDTIEPSPSPDSIPTRIVIPAIVLDAPVVVSHLETIIVDGGEQSTWSVPAERAVGFHQGSALLGAVGNTVLNGHNTTNGEVFRDLHLAQPGDQILVYSDSEPFYYQIVESLILPEAGQPLSVRIANAQYAQPTEDERLTLITCHPYGSIRNRLIVIATPLQ